MKAAIALFLVFVMVGFSAPRPDDPVVITRDAIRYAIPQSPTTTSTTSTTSTTVMAARPVNGKCPDFEPMFKEYGLEPVEVFSYIAYRESRCRIKAINARFDEDGNVVWTLNKNGSIDRGLLQVNSSWRSVTKRICGTDLDGLLILDCNLRVAKYLLDNGGLGHWGMADN